VNARDKRGHDEVSGEAPFVNSQNTSRPLDTVGMLIMLALTLSWGMNQVSVKLALPEIPPFMQATVRSAGAFIVVLLWARWRGVSLTARDGTLVAGLIAGALFGIEFALIFPALQFTTASRATLFVNTAPFFVALGSMVLLGERLRAIQWFGMFCSFAGLAVAFGLHTPDNSRQLIGDLMMIAAGLAWGATTLAIKATALRTAPPEKVFAYQIGVSVPILAAGMLIAGERLTAWPSTWAMGWLAYQTLWVVSLTFAVWFAMVQRYSASRLSAFTFLTPLFGVVWGHFVLGEPITWDFGLAVALVLAGLVLVNRPN